MSFLAAVTHLDEGEILTSESLEKLLAPTYDALKLSQGRIEMQSGIGSRRMWPVGTLPSHLSTRAAQQLFQKESIDPSLIDMVIHASVCRDVLEPATATTVHHNLGLSEDCQAFDLSNACLGVLNAATVADSYIRAGVAKNILIVSGENASPLIMNTVQTLNEQSKNGLLTRKKLRPYFANFTIGSAATAWLISESREGALARIEGATQKTDSTANQLCRGGGDVRELSMQTDAPELLKAGLELAGKTFQKFREIYSDEINLAIGHQVSATHNMGLRKAFAIESIPEKVSYPLWGNTGSAALPLTLSLAVEEGNIKKGDHVALMGIGSGLSCLMMSLKWIK